MYMSIRTYRLKSGSIEEALRLTDQLLAEAFVNEPGFLAYEVARTGERTVASVTIFRERAYAQASNKVATHWVATELAAFEPEQLGVIGGEVKVSRASAALLEAVH